MSKADNETLDALHSAVAEVLAKRLRGDEVTAADISVAVKFLKDNGITASVTSPAVQNVLHNLPFTGEEDEPHAAH
ncbi:hypothetical protein EJV44_22425 [Ancylobacter aquaticus]|nr:hypothetical protein EJV44_22425 [Ancylobacter aquaticus]